MNVRRAAILGTLAAVLLGCGEERPAINRVQPLALKKSFFVGDKLRDDSDNPEFYTQATLIDVGYGAAQDGLFTSTYTQKMTRIRWQITEDHLFARLAYELIDGSDRKGAGKAINDGQIVASFKIEKHFDVARDYNPTTGEQLNVLVENSTDRPWYERQYFHVDWSKNENTNAYDFDTLSMLGVFGGVTYEPLAYDVTDPNDPHRPVFDVEGGYFDVTNKAFATPANVDLSSLGVAGLKTVPACMMPSDFSGGTSPEGNCNPVELTIRQGFRKVQDNDFEPKNWDGYRFQAAGGFTVERYGYARNYGMSDDKWHRFLSHYQIWERSHAYQNPETMEGPVECYTTKTTPLTADPHRDLNADGTEDECKAAGVGSKCDTFKQRCTLPFSQRKTRTIAWYYTQGESEKYFDATAEATHQWDVALRVSVRAAQYAECMATSSKDCGKKFPMYNGQQDDNQDAIDLAREVDACRNGVAYGGDDCNAVADRVGKERKYKDAVISIAKMPEMVVLCHSPVQAKDPAACGDSRLPEGTTAEGCAAARVAGDAETVATCDKARNVRMGDLRYHQVNVLSKPQTPSPWGIYTDAHDPLSGETISASINVWGHVNDIASQQQTDLMRYIKGELTTADVTDGKFVREWVQAQKQAAAGGVLPKVTKEELDKKVASFAGMSVAELAQAKQAVQTSPALLQKALALQQELTSVTASSTVLPSRFAAEAARRDAAAGTEFEAKLMTDQMQEYAGVKGLPLSPSLLQRASPLGGNNPAVRRYLDNLMENKLAERGSCILHDHRVAAPLSLPALADAMEKKFGRFNKGDSKDNQLKRSGTVQEYLARRFHTSVIAHEMGHSMGLRHNFVSSSDAWQYRPQYWQLRTRDGAVTKVCTDLAKDGNTCVGPRWFDPVTQEERDNLIWMWMHSTVMEYPGEITQDMMGLSIWDFAAARLFYGDVASVSANPEVTAGSPRGKVTLAKMDNFGGIIGMHPGEYVAAQNAITFYHYSEMQNRLKLIQNCHPIPNPEIFKPKAWDEKRDGKWDPLIDGMMVKVNGQYTRCEQEKVDYLPWTALEMPKATEIAGYYRGGPSIDRKTGRIRMPYGFGTDSWADLGNLSVYRHDNGADGYEIFDFMISQQEVGHIFDNYRRGRQTFSVREAVERTLTRYNAKLRDGAKGLGLMKNVYRQVALNEGYNFDQFWGAVGSMLLSDNIIASSMVFDHFARTLARPEVGEHYMPSWSTVLRSKNDDFSQGGQTLVLVPNGATGYFESVGIGGRLVENKLAEDKGEYNVRYTVNAGSYYEKLFTAMLMTESVDNFVSASRLDFVDPRYRSVSLADLFPDGYRRWLANYLTGDEEVKGPRLAANAAGVPIVDDHQYPATPIGWTSWWGDQPTVCFPGDGTAICGAPVGPGSVQLKPNQPTKTAVLDSQVGWEQQKFLIAWTLLYLPENEKSGWLDMLRVFDLGTDADPKIDNRIEFHHPTGRVFVAKTYGKETLFGKTVQKGIAARVLEQANEYLKAAYETEAGPDLDGDKQPDWYLPKLSPTTGQPIVKYDPTIRTPTLIPLPVDGCNANDNSKCTCVLNRACTKLEDYIQVPAYLREALSAYRLGVPRERGIY